MVRIKGSNKTVEPDGRETLSVLDWGTGKIESTPHGFFAKMTSVKPETNPRPNLKNLYASCVEFDHYAVAMGNEHSAIEFPLGKKVNFAENKKQTEIVYDTTGDAEAAGYK